MHVPGVNIFIGVAAADYATVEKMATPLKVIGKGHTPQIDREFHSLIAPLKPEEHRQLEANLRAEGCRDAFVVWNSLLLDGHNRLEICSRLHIAYKTSNIELPNREAAKLWIEENQVGRRNLTPDQRAAIALEFSSGVLQFPGGNVPERVDWRAVPGDRGSAWWSHRPPSRNVHANGKSQPSNSASRRGMSV
jgi:hypothetical protein